MPTKGEKDAVTGVETTGHEWDGIKELNNPLPGWWLKTFYVCIAFSVLWWILYPAWPMFGGYTTGILGSNQRLDLEASLEAARAEQAVWLERIAAADTAAVRDDAELLQFSMIGGGAAFKTNCAPCHGLGGAGQGFYPSLADDAWIWGGDLEAIEYAIRHGIRNDADPEARFNIMPAYGADGLFDRDQIAQVTAYVLSLGGRESEAGPEAVAEGEVLFAENCAACHGEDGKGIYELGAPNLTDAVWLYGSTEEEIAAQIHNPRLGVMPPWQGRLDETTIRMLTVYVHSLGGGQ